MSRKAYARKIYVDREFLQKTNELVQSKISSTEIGFKNEFVKINSETINRIKAKNDESPARVINLVMSIEKIAENESEDPFLIGLLERAEQVQSRYEDRQTSTQEAIAELISEIEKENQRKKEQAEKNVRDLKADAKIDSQPYVDNPLSWMRRKK